MFAPHHRMLLNGNSPKLRHSPYITGPKILWCESKFATGRTCTVALDIATRLISPKVHLRLKISMWTRRYSIHWYTIYAYYMQIYGFFIPGFRESRWPELGFQSRGATIQRHHKLCTKCRWACKNDSHFKQLVDVSWKWQDVNLVMIFEMLLSLSIVQAIAHFGKEAGLGGHWLQGSTARWYHEKGVVPFDHWFQLWTIRDVSLWRYRHKHNRAKILEAEFSSFPASIYLYWGM